MTRETAYWLAISRWPQIGARRIKRLKDELHTGQAIWQAEKDVFREILGMTETAVSEIITLRGKQDPEALLKQVTAAGAWVVSWVDSGYPPSLLELFDPPSVLLGWGQTLSSHARHLAVVGARRMTSYGKRVTEELIAGLVGNDVVIISGLAIGVDGTAHQAALSNGLLTWAVLGSGFAHLYPERHRELALRIVEQGGTLLSEYWPDMRPDVHHFPARNRIIAGLSDAVLVVEADEKSGSLITVDHALDLGKDIWAVPGNVTSRLSRGTNKMLKQGATMIMSSEDILAEWEWGGGNFSQPQVPELTGTQAKVYEALNDQDTDLDTVIATTGLATAEVLAILMEFELSGWVEATPGQNYRLTAFKEHNPGV